MTIPLCYIAGPYRAPTREAIDLNIQAAKHVAALVCRKGWGPVCPHLNTAHMDLILPEIGDEFWLEATMEMMKRCAAVVLVPGWSYSSGTLAEIEEAKRLGIPVYESVDHMPAAVERSRVGAAA